MFNKLQTTLIQYPAGNTRTTYTITNSVTSILDYAFSACTSLNAFAVDASNLNYSNDAFGVLFNKLQTSLKQYPAGNTQTTYTIPNSVTSILVYAFNNCASLNSMSIPNSVTSIGGLAFQKCINLNIVYFLQVSSIPTIGSSAFSEIKTPSVGKYYSGVLNISRIQPPVFTSISPISPEPSSTPCFLEGSKILCFENNEEVYRPIESLRKGDLVKTIYNGYMPVCMMGTSSIYNPGNDYRVTNRLYKCPKENYPSLFEDLYITGCHSILVLVMTDDQWENTKAVNGDVYVTDKHFRLIACADEKAEPFKKEGFMNIYHIALDHHNIRMNYGIYANGLLVESCSIDYLIKYSNMKILGENISAVCQDVDKVSNNMTYQLVDTY